MWFRVICQTMSDPLKSDPLKFQRINVTRTILHMAQCTETCSMGWQCNQINLKTKQKHVLCTAIYFGVALVYGQSLDGSVHVL